MKEKGILLFLKYLHLIINKIFLNVSVHAPTEGAPLLLHGGVTPSGRTHQTLLLRAGEVSDEPVHLQHPLPGKHAVHNVISHEGSRCLGRLKKFPFKKDWKNLVLIFHNETGGRPLPEVRLIIGESQKQPDNDPLPGASRVLEGYYIVERNVVNPRDGQREKT